MPSLPQLIPLATGLIISPLPIVAVVAIVLGVRGKAAAMAYTVAYAGVAFAVTVVTAFTTHAAVRATGVKHSTVNVVVSVVVGLLFLAFAALSWRGRPAPGVSAKPPAWLAKAETLSLGGCALLGAGMSLTQTKNLLAEVKAGTIIAAVDHNPVFVISMALLFAVVGALALIVPTLMATSGSPRARQQLEALKAEMIEHNALMMAVLFAILGAVEIEHALTALTT